MIADDVPSGVALKPDSAETEPRFAVGIRNTENLWNLRELGAERLLIHMVRSVRVFDHDQRIARRAEPGASELGILEPRERDADQQQACDGELRTDQ